MATPHQDATAAGRNALRTGGNAIDAALAAAAMLTVVYPNQCGIGGDAIALVSTPDGRATVVNGSGRSAAVLDPVDYATSDGFMPVSGAKSVTVPGALGVWQALADNWGSKPLSGALAPAAAAAGEGVRIMPGLQRDLAREQANLAKDEGAREIFFRDGRILAGNDVLRLDRLSETLSAIAASGTETFYRGEIGRSVVARLKRLGGDLTLRDFSDFAPRIEQAILIEFGGEDYLSAGGNSQGTFFLRGLGALEVIARETGSVPDPIGGSARLVARVLALAAGERDDLLADPDHGGRSLDELLRRPSLAELTRLARSDGQVRAMVAATRTDARRTGDTVAIVAADNQGNWISLIQSLFHAFGSCVLDPETGILLHNRGASFSLHPQSPNRLAPAKRPAHTLMPVLVRKDGVTVGAHGTMGGRAQPQIHTHLALNLALGFDAEAAVSRPRWVIGQLEAGASRTDDAITIATETDVPAETKRLFAGDGFLLREIPRRDDDTGHAQVIRRRRPPESLQVGSDPRADG